MANAQLQEARTANRMQQLEAIISNPALSVVSRGKAKVELTLLNEWALKAKYGQKIAERDKKIRELQKIVGQEAKALLDDKDALASDLRSQIKQLQKEKEELSQVQHFYTDLVQMEQVLLQQKQENEKLTSKLKFYRDKVAKLEQINDVQSFEIESMKQQLSKNDSVEEASVVSTLSSTTGSLSSIWVQ